MSARRSTPPLWLATLVACALACGSTARRRLARVAERIPPAQPRPETLDVLAYNTWMLPPLAVDRRERAVAIPAHLRGYDAIVLSELFDAEARRIIVEALTAAGYHATPVLGGGRRPRCGRRFGPVELAINRGLDGGVVILARDPIAHVEERPFGELCAGEDCCAAKGVLYARLRRGPGQYVHVFGTHLQNQSPAVGRQDPRAIRQAQLRRVRAFVDEVVDPATHPGPVVVAGDLNLLPEELPEALQILHARPPAPLRGPPSWGAHNTYATSDQPEHLDYVLVTDDYRAPVFASHETRLFRAVHPVTRGTGLLGLQGAAVLADLSDHHPVVGHFEWDRPVADRVLSVGRCPPVEGTPLCAEPATALAVRGGALCGEDLEGVFCRDGLAAPPCDAWTGARCLQLASPEDARAERYDDFVCYRRADDRGRRRCRRR